ncbi:hypothetical protein [Paenibacillus eucommiae]|uniref:Sugar-specific transcriptional regulator TrmB n=1 Tax=Paenibacillus eucommiae TaxID=1355755 RepID=A0ABS4INJ9_9BACL|nr:hypothetical protein [Paenibacillus eucommiae]MBP1989119.1 sugar-specific transcriptional regulator TrmB [Paenibacillus eucommiae]
MRTENQIKRKINELKLQKQSIASQLEQALDNEQSSIETIKSLTAKAELLDDSISMLEWVIEAPTGSYHV